MRPARKAAGIRVNTSVEPCELLVDAAVELGAERRPGRGHGGPAPTAPAPRQEPHDHGAPEDPGDREDPGEQPEPVFRRLCEYALAELGNELRLDLALRVAGGDARRDEALDPKRD